MAASPRVEREVAKVAARVEVAKVAEVAKVVEVKRRAEVAKVVAAVEAVAKRNELSLRILLFDLQYAAAALIDEGTVTFFL